MSKTLKRGSRFVSPMPVRLDTEALLRVSDQGGRVVRSEALSAGTDLHARLLLARENYARQGWGVGELHSGQWAFVAEKGERRLLIAIRATQSVAAVAAAGALDRVQ
jgi:hypothetical protein